MDLPKLQVTLQGCVDVAFRREERDWYATALQFDIIGYGKTRALALKMLQELVSIYLQETAKTIAGGGKVKFFNPSDSETWNNNQGIESYGVRFTFTTDAPPRKAQRELTQLVEFIDSLGRTGADSIEEVELIACDF